MATKTKNKKETYQQRKARDTEPGFSETCVKRFDEYLDTTGAVIDSAVDEVIKLLENEFINPGIVEEVKGKLESMKTELSEADVNYKADLEKATDMDDEKVAKIIKELQPDESDTFDLLKRLDFDHVCRYVERELNDERVIVKGLTEMQKEKLRAFIEAELYPAYNDQIKYVSGL